MLQKSSKKLSKNVSKIFAKIARSVAKMVQKVLQKSSKKVYQKFMLQMLCLETNLRRLPQWTLFWLQTVTAGKFTWEKDLFVEKISDHLPVFNSLKSNTVSIAVISKSECLSMTTALETFWTKKGNRVLNEQGCKVPNTSNNPSPFTEQRPNSKRNMVYETLCWGWLKLRLLSESTSTWVRRVAKNWVRMGGYGVRWVANWVRWVAN